ncbi:TVP38/TMEM64 family protein [Evansella sp. AB-rgal1]|uniref:TVP38/TMEM64 family protein n=1 Tax=Evansella sp. AB-rgal1 TaxID=3242696 RepID=UPI00359D195E
MENILKIGDEMKKGILMLVGFGIILYLIDWEWVAHLRQEDMEYFTGGVIDGLGYNLLLITMPLMIVQGVITIFPVLLLIILHFLSFGLIQGFFISLLGTVLSSLFCYWLTKSFSSKWVDHYWEKRKHKLNRFVKIFTHYGVLMIIFFRSVPFIPSNLISIAAAISPIHFKQYIWSSIWGNISMIWLLSILSAPIWMSDSIFLPYLSSYLAYVVILLTYYGIRYLRIERYELEGRRSLEKAR